MEIGCHIWDNKSDTLQFIQNFIGVQLEVMSPPPKLVYGSWKFPYDWKNVVFELNSVLRGRFSIQSIKKIAESFFMPQDYYYPKGGAKELRDGLLELINKSTVQVELGKSLSHLRIFDSSIDVQSTSEVISCKELKITSLSCFNSIEINNQKLAHHTAKFVNYIHCHLQFSDSLTGNFSYHRLYKDAVIHRISDITSQVELNSESNNTQRIILVGVYLTAYKAMEKNELVKYIITKLQLLKLLGKKAELVNHCWNEYPVSYMSHELRDKLNSQSNVELLHSTNLIYGLDRQLTKWKQLLN